MFAISEEHYIGITLKYDTR